MEHVRVLALFLHPLNSSRRENCACQPLCTTFEGKGTPYNQIKQNAKEFQSFGINWDTISIIFWNFDLRFMYNLDLHVVPLCPTILEVF
jgi:hypothetical protein